MHKRSSSVEAGRLPGPLNQLQVRLDARLLIVTLIGTFVFLWPLLVFGRPGYIQDSAAYYKGGKAAVEFVVNKIDGTGPEAPAPVSSGGEGNSISPAEAAANPQAVQGARSIEYSVAAYVFGAPNAKMFVLAGMQALLTALIGAITLLTFGNGTASATWKLAALSVASTAALVAIGAVPDIFAGLLIAAVVLLATRLDRLSTGVRLVLAFVIAFAIAAHASHVPIGGGLIMASIAWLWFRRWKGRPSPRGAWAWLAAPLLLGCVSTVLVHAVAFGSPSLAGKRYPLTLARSISDGPGKWYLDENCSHLSYTICKIYPNGVPGTVPDLLWGPNGLRYRATPEQMDRVRAEEAEIVFAATRAYPLYELRDFTSNFVRQIFRFEPGLWLNYEIVREPDGTPKLKEAPYNKAWRRAVHWLSIIGVAVAALWLALRYWKSDSVRPVIILMVLGILLNLAVCVYFSGIVDRYEARVIWLVELFALALVGQRSLRDGEDRVALR